MLDTSLFSQTVELISHTIPWAYKWIKLYSEGYKSSVAEYGIQVVDFQKAALFT